MEKIQIINKDIDITLLMERIKIFYGNNYSKKYSIVRYIEQHIEKANNTEYNQEKGIATKLKLNDRELDSREVNFINVNGYFNFDNDIKLGTKSLSLKYIENELKDIEYDDDFNTVSQLLVSLGERISEQHNIIFDNLQLSLKIDELTLKQLTKLLYVEIKKDNYITNQYNLTYNHIIKLQILLIKNLAENDLTKKYFVCFDTHIDEELLEFIYQNFTSNNIYCFVLPNVTINSEKQKDLLFINSKIIDLADDIKIYNEILMSLPFHIERTDFALLIDDYLKNKSSNQTIELEKLL